MGWSSKYEPINQMTCHSGFFPGAISARWPVKADGLLRGASGVSGALLGEPKMAEGAEIQRSLHQILWNSVMVANSNVFWNFHLENWGNEIPILRLLFFKGGWNHQLELNRGVDCLTDLPSSLALFGLLMVQKSGVHHLGCRKPCK